MQRFAPRILPLALNFTHLSVTPRPLSPLPPPSDLFLTTQILGADRKKPFHVTLYHWLVLRKNATRSTINRTEKTDEKTHKCIIQKHTAGLTDKNGSNTLKLLDEHNIYKDKMKWNITGSVSQAILQ